MGSSFHIDICSKELNTLEFIIRLTKEFSLNNTVKAMYCSETHFGVRFTNLGPTYCKWFYSTWKRLEYIFKVLGIQCPPHDYFPVSRILDLKSLADRWRMLGKTLLRGLLSNDIDSSSLLSLINFKVPQFSTRTPMSFHIPQFKSNYMKKEPLRRIIYIANENSPLS